MQPITEGDQNLSDTRASWLKASSSQRKLVDRDARAYYHQILSSPCLDQIVSAGGPWIQTSDGRRLLDFHGNSVHQVGFSHPRVIEAIIKQITNLSYCTRRYTNTRAIELAERLVSLAPGKLNNNSRVLLSPSGAAAVGIALKIARAHTGRYKTIAFNDSFHGATLDTCSISGQELFHRGLGPMLPGITHLEPPTSETTKPCKKNCNGSNCGCEIVNTLDEHGDFAAIIAEPIRSTTVQHGSKEYWRRVREACDRNGTLLIFDEIPSGLGRTGYFWSSQLTGITPDLIVLGKGLGGGVFPQAAVIGNSSMNEQGHVPIRELALGHYTHEKSPLGCAAALATIDIIQHEGLVQRANEVGSRWKNLVKEHLDGQRGIREIRQTGMMLAIELKDPTHAERAMYESHRKGLSYKIGGGNTLILCPPLNIEEPLLHQATTMTCSSIASTYIPKSSVHYSRM